MEQIETIQVTAVEAAIAWLRACSDWLLAHDHDMQMPGGILDTDPLDIADALAAHRIQARSIDADLERVREWPKPTPNYSTKATFDQLIRWLSDVNGGFWNWCGNSRCKYVTIGIDTRAGAYSIKDRDGNDLSIDQLIYQRGDHLSEAMTERGEGVSGIGGG